MTTETNNELVEYEYEVWQSGVLQAGGREPDYDSAQSEANHYAKMYVPDGPVEVRIYEKRLLSTVQQQPSEEAERDWLAEALDALADRRFDALFGGLSDADREAALRAEIKKLRREAEEWRDYAEAQMELRDEAESHAEALAESLAELITWIPTGDVYRRLGFDPEAPMLALKRAKLAMGSMGGLYND